MLQGFHVKCQYRVTGQQDFIKKKKEKVPCNLTLVVAKERAQVARIAGLAK